MEIKIKRDSIADLKWQKKISELEARSIKMIQSKKHQKEGKKCEYFRPLGPVKCSCIYINRFKKREEKKRQKIFEKMTKTFTTFWENLSMHIQETQGTPKDKFKETDTQMHHNETAKNQRQRRYLEIAKVK